MNQNPNPPTPAASVTTKGVEWRPICPNDQNFGDEARGEAVNRTNSEICGNCFDKLLAVIPKEMHTNIGNKVITITIRY